MRRLGILIIIVLAVSGVVFIPSRSDAIPNALCASWESLTRSMAQECREQGWTIARHRVVSNHGVNYRGTTRHDRFHGMTRYWYRHNGHRVYVWRFLPSNGYHWKGRCQTNGTITICPNGKRY